MFLKDKFLKKHFFVLRIFIYISSCASPIYLIYILTYNQIEQATLSKL